MEIEVHNSFGINTYDELLMAFATSVRHVTCTYVELVFAGCLGRLGVRHNDTSHPAYRVSWPRPLPDAISILLSFDAK